MKTSSKLLIILGLALFIVPITILSFTVMQTQVNYTDYENDMAREKATVGTTDNYLQTTLLKPFHTVFVKGEGENTQINLIIVESDTYALKTEKGKSLPTNTVDDNGVLTLDGGPTSDPSTTTYYLFTPALNKIDLHNVVVNTEIDADSLAVQGDHVFGFRILSGSKLKKLELTAAHSNILLGNQQRDEENSMILEDAVLTLDSCELILENIDLKRVNVTAENSKINFVNKDKNWQLAELKLTTDGVNTIRLDSLAVGKLSGKISEQTLIDLPVYQLRPLIGDR